MVQELTWLLWSLFFTSEVTNHREKLSTWLGKSLAASHNMCCTISEQVLLWHIPRGISFQKRKKPANLHSDWLNLPNSMFPSNKKPCVPHLVHRTWDSLYVLTLCWGLNKSAFAFISVPSLNSFIPGNKKSSSTARSQAHL